MFVLNKPFTYKIYIAQANDKKNYVDLIIGFIHCTMKAMLKINVYLKAKSKVMHQHMYTQIQQCQYKTVYDYKHLLCILSI